MDHFETLATGLEARRFEVAKRENDQEYGNLRWVSEIWTAQRSFDGARVELRFGGMADDALTTLPIEKSHWVRMFDTKGIMLAELDMFKRGTQTEWKSRVNTFLSALESSELKGRAE